MIDTTTSPALKTFTQIVYVLFCIFATSRALKPCFHFRFYACLDLSVGSMDLGCTLRIAPHIPPCGIFVPALKTFTQIVICTILYFCHISRVKSMLSFSFLRLPRFVSWVYGSGLHTSHCAAHSTLWYFRTHCLSIEKWANEGLSRGEVHLCMENICQLCKEPAPTDWFFLFFFWMENINFTNAAT